MRSRLGDSDVEMTTSRIVARGELFVPYVGDEQANVSPTAAARLHRLPSSFTPVANQHPAIYHQRLVRSATNHSPGISTVRSVRVSVVKLSRTGDGNEESLNSNREG